VSSNQRVTGRSGRSGRSGGAEPTASRRRLVRRVLVAVTVVLLVFAVAAFIEGTKSGAGDVLVLVAAVMFGVAALALLLLAFW
jgi:protein-S-isoprenylcysteine O-methyltransferase Ste14